MGLWSLQKDTSGQAKIVAIKGDPAAPVNRGLNCIKGYFNAKIMYGEDRLVMPLLRVNSKGEFDKKGKFQQFRGKELLMKWKSNLKKLIMSLELLALEFLVADNIPSKKAMQASNLQKRF